MLNLGFRFLVVCTTLLVSSPVFSKTLSVSDFIAPPDFVSAEFSPNGRYLATVRNKEGTRFVTIFDMEKPEKKVVSQFGDSMVRPNTVQWVNNERLIVHMLIPERVHELKKTDHYGEPNTIDSIANMSRAVSVDIHGKDPVILMEGGKPFYIRHFLPDDKKHVLIASEKHNIEVLYKVNVYNGDMEMVAEGIKRTARFLSDQQGNPKYRFDWFYLEKSYVIYERKADGSWKKIDKIYVNDEGEEGEQSVGMMGLIGILDDGRLVYRRESKETGYYEIMAYSPQSGERETYLSFPNKDVWGLLYGYRNDTVIGYVTADSTLRFNYFDKDEQALYEKLSERLGNKVVRMLSVGDEKKRRLIWTNSQNDPGSYYLYDYTEDKLSFHATRYNNLNENTLATPAIASYLTRDKQKIESYILFPPEYKQGEKYPLIVMPHGGPHARDFNGFSNFSQFLATRGYVVIKPNFRGSVGYGKEFKEAGYMQWGGVMQEDLEDAVDFMVRKGFADSSRVCIVGGSYGGYAALMGTVKTPDLYKCSVGLNGVYNLPKMMKHDRKLFRRYPVIMERIINTIGEPEKDREWRKQHSPALLAKQIKSPSLIVVGEYDRRVSWKQGKEMKNALKRAKVPVDYMKVKWAGHNVFSWQPNKREVYKKVEEFLTENL